MIDKDLRNIIIHRTRNTFGILLFLFLFLFFITACKAVPGKNKKDNRPNIVLIMADDMGFSDLGCYGGEIATPNLDYLAANGLRFTNFYNNSRCCPTRASLLTGLYNHEAGIGNMSNDQHEPGYRGALLSTTVTLAEVLQQAGYHTAMAGKWHVSNTISQDDPAAQLNWLNHQEIHPSFSPMEQYPVNRGFEKFYGTLWGVVDYFDPFSLVYNSTPVTEVPPGYYHTDALNDSAASFIRQFSKDAQPFFIYLAHNAPHWPVQALPEDIQKYKDTYTKGWDFIREKRYKRLVEEGIINASSEKLSPRENEDDRWESNKDKTYDARAMAVHAAMIDRMDQGIGRVITALRETGRLDNTLILFLSDNGASPEICAAFGPGFDRPGKTRDGQKIIYPANKEALPGPQTVYASIGPQWANVANTPFRYWKIESFEGGIHTPFIAYWPKGITTKKGAVTQQPGHVMDIMATLADIAGARYPATYHGHDITPTDGISLLPVLKGKTRHGHDLLFNEHNNRRYARKGKWKIVTTGIDTTWQLYNMEEDGTEINNLAAQHPEIVEDLNGRWQDWAQRKNVFPKPIKAKPINK